jgi:hypothetical protein
MTITLFQRDPWCYSFDCKEVNINTLNSLIDSDEEVVLEDKVQKGNDRKRILTIAALDTMLDQYVENGNKTKLFNEARDEVRSFMDSYAYDPAAYDSNDNNSNNNNGNNDKNIDGGSYDNNRYDPELVWEIAVFLGTSKPKDAVDWLLG